jgi:hypothetical protein
MVGPITDGRVEIRDATLLRGNAPASFEIKRSPAKPLPFATGVPAVLLLRGARSPYVLVDEPREIVLLRDVADAKRWTDALQALEAASAEPNRLLQIYLAWLDGDDEKFREAAGAALSDFRAPFLPLGREDALLRARAALDPGRPAPTRRVSAMLAMTQADGAAALVEGIPGEAADPQLIATALRAVIPVARERRVAALLRALADEERDVRRAALSAAPALWSDAVAARVATMAASDPDPQVRADAQNAKARGGKWVDSEHRTNRPTRSLDRNLPTSGVGEAHGARTEPKANDTRRAASSQSPRPATA